MITCQENATKRTNRENLIGLTNINKRVQVLVSLGNENSYEQTCFLDEAENSKVFDSYMIDLYLIRGGRG